MHFNAIKGIVTVGGRAHIGCPYAGGHLEGSLVVSVVSGEGGLDVWNSATPRLPGNTEVT